MRILELISVGHPGFGRLRARTRLRRVPAASRRLSDILRYITCGVAPCLTGSRSALGRGYPPAKRVGRTYRNRLLATALACVFSGVVLCPGCSSPAKKFRLTSFPTGAKIYLDDVYQGTAESTGYVLQVPFDTKLLAALRLEKEKYQPVGAMLCPESPEEMNFVLQEAPKNAEIIEVLQKMLKVLDRIEARINAGQSGTTQ